MSLKIRHKYHDTVHSIKGFRKHFTSNQNSTNFNRLFVHDLGEYCHDFIKLELATYHIRKFPVALGSTTTLRYEWYLKLYNSYPTWNLYICIFVLYKKYCIHCRIFRKIPLLKAAFVKDFNATDEKLNNNTSNCILVLQTKQLILGEIVQSNLVRVVVRERVVTWKISCAIVTAFMLKCTVALVL